MKEEILIYAYEVKSVLHRLFKMKTILWQCLEFKWINNKKANMATPFFLLSKIQFIIMPQYSKNRKKSFCWEDVEKYVKS